MCCGAWSSQIGPWCSTDNTQCPGPAQGPGSSSWGPSRRASRLVRQGPSWGLGASHRRGPSQTQARGLRPAYSPSKSCWHFSYQTYPANARTDVFRRPGGPGPRGAGPLGSRISPRLNFHGRAALKFSALNSHTHTHTPHPASNSFPPGPAERLPGLGRPGPGAGRLSTSQGAGCLSLVWAGRVQVPPWSWS